MVTMTGIMSTKCRLTATVADITEVPSWVPHLRLSRKLEGLMIPTLASEHLSHACVGETGFSKPPFNTALLLGLVLLFH